jgi:hypothetical protein
MNVYFKKLVENKSKKVNFNITFVNAVKNCNALLKDGMKMAFGNVQ